MIVYVRNVGYGVNILVLGVFVFLAVAGISTLQIGPKGPTPNGLT